MRLLISGSDSQDTAGREHEVSQMEQVPLESLCMAVVMQVSFITEVHSLVTIIWQTEFVRQKFA